MTTRYCHFERNEVKSKHEAESRTDEINLNKKRLLLQSEWKRDPSFRQDDSMSKQTALGFKGVK